MKTLTEKRFFHWAEDDISVTLRSRSGSYGGGSEVFVIDSMSTDKTMNNKSISLETYHCYADFEKTSPLKARDYKDPISLIEGNAMEKVVRRLTPLECTRLQGFPDGWVDIGDWVDTKGKLHKEADTPKYKALGNSIAVGYANNQSGFWMVLMKRISAQYERSATLGSLFDGISGFPLAWARYNGAENCRWASEIEEFPIAVCKRHFGDEDAGIEGDIKDYL